MRTRPTGRVGGFAAAVDKGGGTPLDKLHRLTAALHGRIRFDTGQTQSDTTAHEAFAAGHGVSLLPRYTFGGARGVRLVPLAGVRAGRRIDALLRRDRAERLVVRRVLEELRGLAAEIDVD